MLQHVGDTDIGQAQLIADKVSIVTIVLQVALEGFAKTGQAVGLEVGKTLGRGLGLVPGDEAGKHILERV